MLHHIILLVVLSSVPTHSIILILSAQVILHPLQWPTPLLPASWPLTACRTSRGPPAVDRWWVSRTLPSAMLHAPTNSNHGLQHYNSLLFYEQTLSWSINFSEIFPICFSLMFFGICYVLDHLILGYSMCDCHALKDFDTVLKLYCDNIIKS